MHCTCVRQTELPHTSRLFADLVYHPDRLAAFYPYSAFRPGAYEKSARKIDFPAERRAALVEALRPQNADREALRKLGQPGTVAVVTGQQVGLFSGPAYTIYKALAAAKLARTLTEQGIPAVPVFWLATEDHDFAEVNHGWVFDAAHTPVKVEMSRAPSSTQPVGLFELVNPPVEALRSALGGFPYGEEVTALVEEAYRPGATLGQAFRALLDLLLSEYGLVQVDPMAPAIRELAAPAIAAALEAAPDISAAVLERNQELIAAGYHAQVHVEEHTSFVFLLENGRRLTLRRHKTDYILNGRRFTTPELMARARELSPNALLRPVVQDSILPTAAYVGGPAELAYLAQSAVIYERVLGRMPVAVPRAGFTLLDQRARKLMEGYGLCLPDFFRGEEALREHIAARLVPPAVTSALASAKLTVDGALEKLSSGLEGFDPTLVRALGKSQAKIRYQLGKMERKIGRETLSRDAKASRDAAYLNGLIYPEKHLQERLYSILPFLAKHGLELIPQLYEQVRLDCPDHRLVVV